MAPLSADVRDYWWHVHMYCKRARLLSSHLWLFIHSFIHSKASFLKLHDQKNRIEFLPTYPSLKVSSRPISVEGRGHGWSFPESYTDHNVSVNRLVTPLVSWKKKHFVWNSGKQKSYRGYNKNRFALTRNNFLTLLLFPPAVNTSISTIINYVFLRLWILYLFPFSTSKSFHG